MTAATVSRLALSLRALPGLFFAQSQHSLLGDTSPGNRAGCWVLISAVDSAGGAGAAGGTVVLGLGGGWDEALGDGMVQGVGLGGGMEQEAG